MTRIEIGLRGDSPSQETVEEISRLAVPASTGLGRDDWQAVADTYSRLSRERLFDFAIAVVRSPSG